MTVSWDEFEYVARTHSDDSTIAFEMVGAVEALRYIELQDCREDTRQAIAAKLREVFKGAPADSFATLLSYQPDTDWLHGLFDLTIYVPSRDLKIMGSWHAGIYEPSDEASIPQESCWFVDGETRHGNVKNAVASDLDGIVAAEAFIWGHHGKA